MPDGVSMAAVELARKLRARAIVSLTRSGSTATMVSKYRPECPILAVTPSEKSCREMCLYWGVFPVMCPEGGTEEQTIKDAVRTVMQRGYAEEGDMLVITAGMPLGVSGTTNMLRVYTIGQIVARGLPVLPGVVTGRVLVVKKVEDLVGIQNGDVLVTGSTTKDYVKYLDKVSAVVTEEGGLTSHAAIVSLELGLPCIVGAKGAVASLRTGMVVTVDTKAGLVYKGVVNTGARTGA